MVAAASRGNNPNSGDEIRILGDFESGLDDWRTNGRTDLERIGIEERPAAISSGQFGLECTVNGDAYPMISNSKRAMDANWVDSPYLLATVSAEPPANIESTITFRFRLHVDEKGGRGAQNGETTITSEKMEVPLFLPTQLSWNLDDVDDRTLERVKRLDIAWYPTGSPPETTPEGETRGPTYNGEVVFDNIRLVRDRGALSAAQYSKLWNDLRAAHGIYVKTIIEEAGEGYEAGEYVFDDGTHVPFEFEVASSDEFVLTISGQEFVFGGTDE